jgi:hypothetical protein
VVEMRPVEEELIDRIELYMSANYAFTKASGVSQTEFIADVSFNQRDAVNTLTSRLTISDTDTDSTSSSRFNAQRQTWTDREKMFRLLFGGFESNDELGLDSRYSFGGGLGRYFIDTNNATLGGALGLQALTENGFEGARRESVEAVIAGSLAVWRFDTPELDLNITTSLYPSLTESGRFRADTTARVRWEIISDLYWNVNAWGSYDSESVEVDGGEFDWGITTGLGWSF